VASDVSERRARRRTAQQLFDELVVDCLHLPRVSRAAMFGSDGLRVGVKFFAFVGRDGQLIVKLPVAQADGLVAAGLATRVQGGRATMGEWIGIPSPDQGCTDQWRDLISETYRYGASLTPSPDER